MRNEVVGFALVVGKFGMTEGRLAKPPNGLPGPGIIWGAIGMKCGAARATRGSKCALSQAHFASVRAASPVAVGMRFVRTHAFAASGVSMVGTTRLSAPRDSEPAS